MEVHHHSHGLGHKWTHYLYEFFMLFLQMIFNSLNLLFDPEVFDKMNIYDIEFVRPPGNPKLLTKEKAVIRNFLSDVHYLKTVNIGQIGWFKKQRQKARMIVEYLQKEYKVD